MYIFVIYILAFKRGNHDHYHVIESTCFWYRPESAFLSGGCDGACGGRLNRSLILAYMPDAFAALSVNSNNRPGISNWRNGHPLAEAPAMMTDDTD